MRLTDGRDAMNVVNPGTRWRTAVILNPKEVTLERPDRENSLSKVVSEWLANV